MIENDTIINNAPEKLQGILEIDNMTFFTNNLINTQDVKRALILGGVILAAILLLWTVDKILTWAVNSHIKNEKRVNPVPIFLFPAMFLGAFIVDYLTIVFRIYEYPWLSLGVLLTKFSYFISSTFWAMKVYGVPITKIFTFIFSVLKAWRNKDASSLYDSFIEFSESDNTAKKEKDKKDKNKINKKIIPIFFLFIFVPIVAIQGVHSPTFSINATGKAHIENVTLNNGIYKNSIIKRVPVYYKGEKIGVFTIYNK